MTAFYSESTLWFLIASRDRGVDLLDQLGGKGSKKATKRHDLFHSTANKSLHWNNDNDNNNEFV